MLDIRLCSNTAGLEYRDSTLRPVNRLLSIAMKPHCLFPWQSTTFVSECPAEYFDHTPEAPVTLPVAVS
jgi:hypothetical protein